MKISLLTVLMLKETVHPLYGQLLLFKNPKIFETPEQSMRAKLKTVSDRPTQVAIISALIADAGLQHEFTQVAPPQPAPVAPAALEVAAAKELPAAPPAWWRDRQPGDTPDKWLKAHYSEFIGHGLTRSFFQRNGQDKAFYNGLLAWEKAGNTLPDHLRLPTRSELVDRQLEAAGGLIAVRDQGRVAVRQAARLYQAANRRIG